MNMKNVRFPVAVKSGSSVVRIYATPNREYPRFTVVYYEAAGQRCRRTFAQFEEAKREAAAIAEKLGRGDLAALRLGDRDRHLYLRALELLQPSGMPLDLAVLQFAEATKLLEGHSLAEAARLYREQHRSQLEIKTVAEVVEEFILDRQKHQLSLLYLRDLRVRLNRFIKAFQCPISSLHTTEIERFLDSLKVSLRTRKNFVTTLGTLFNFARAKGYLSRSHPGVSEVTRSRRQAREIHIFTPEELATLLHRAPLGLVPTLAIGAFAGIRSEEIKRLDWSDVNLAEGFIQIKSSTAKTKVRRLAPLPDNLQEWLEAFAQEEGPVCPYQNLSNAFLKLARRSGVEWKRNALRHSFISYRVARLQDVSKVALEAGNSPKVIFEDYLKVVPGSAAEEWFAIRPQGKGHIVSFPAGPKENPAVGAQDPSSTL